MFRKINSKKNLDHWEYQYITDNPYQNLVPLTDIDAKRYFKKQSWVYNKYELLKFMSQTKIWDLDKELPNQFPVMVKPKENLMGMGKGAYKANSIGDIKETKGMMAQEFLDGNHISTDYAIWEDSIIDEFSFLCHKDDKGSFVVFESINKEDTCDQATYLINKLKINFGFINIETIAGRIIEVHLRPSMQFYDICGGLIGNFLTQFGNKTKVKDYHKSIYEKTYSVITRCEDDMLILNNPKVELSSRLFFRSSQFCWEENKPLSAQEQDEFSYRIMCLNGTNLNFLIKFSKKILEKLTT